MKSQVDKFPINAEFAGSDVRTCLDLNLTFEGDDARPVLIVVLGTESSAALRTCFPVQERITYVKVGFGCPLHRVIAELQYRFSVRNDAQLFGKFRRFSKSKNIRLCQSEVAKMKSKENIVVIDNLHSEFNDHLIDLLGLMNTLRPKIKFFFVIKEQFLNSILKTEGTIQSLMYIFFQKCLRLEFKS